MMKLRLAAVAAISLMSSPLWAQDLSLNVINRTGTAIQEFYASNARSQSWGEDVLGVNIIEPGTRMRIEPANAQRRRGGCQYDLRAVFANGASVERRNVNLCEVVDFTCTSTGNCTVR